LTLLAGWGVLLPASHKWQTELAAKNRGIAEQARELTTLNATLDQRVVERTKDLEASQTAALNMMADAEQARAASEKMEERLRHSQKMEAVGSLVAGVAHDYNNQLQAVLASLEMALEDLGPDSPTYAAVDVAERAAKRSLEITKGLLGFSRGESEAYVCVDLGELLREAGQVLQRVLPANIRFKLSHDEGLWPIMGNATQIQQVLMNLVVNARDAIPSGGTLTIAAANRTIDANRDSSRPQQVVLISVCDTGIGMDPETVSRIFDPFFTTKERGQGTGLGLSLVHGIVQNHGGWIEVRSAVGEGTAFDIFLPAVESAECERPPQESTVCAASSPLSAVFNNQETRHSEE
jgi:signal transduction histidine kinase